MARSKKKSGSTSKDSCVYCGVYVPPTSAMRRKKLSKPKSVKLAKSLSSKVQGPKRKALLKKPTPYPFKRRRVPKLNPKNQPACDHDSCALTSTMQAMSKASMVDPVLNGIMFGIHLGYKYNQEDWSSQYRECTMQAQQDQASPSSGNPSETPNNIGCSPLSNNMNAELLEYALRNIGRGCGHPVACCCNIKHVTSVLSQTEVPSSDGNSSANLMQANASPVIESMLNPADPMLNEDSAQMPEVCPNEEQDEVNETKDMETDVVSKDN